MARPRADLTLADLPVLGLQLLDEFEAGPIEQPPSTLRHVRPTQPIVSSRRVSPRQRSPILRWSLPHPSCSMPIRRKFWPARGLGRRGFRRRPGQGRGLGRSAPTLARVEDRTGRPLLAESREQYIRYAFPYGESPPTSRETMIPPGPSTLWKCCACCLTRCGRVGRRSPAHQISFAHATWAEKLMLLSVLLARRYNRVCWNLQVLRLDSNVRIRRSRTENDNLPSVTRVEDAYGPFHDERLGYAATRRRDPAAGRETDVAARSS